MFLAIKSINCTFAVLLVNNKLLYCHRSAEYFEQFLKSVSRFVSRESNNKTLYLPVGQASCRSKLAYLETDNKYIINNNKTQIIMKAQ